MSNIWFTSDTHFGHANIIKYCDRPFADVRENDETLIANWNHVVGPHDAVYHLGDFGFGRKGQMIEILRRLNGRIFFVKGNHDKSVLKPEVSAYFQWVKDYFELKVRDEEMDMKQPIILCHYAFQVWNKSHHGSWHLHGHSHGTLPSPDTMARLDVGVDAHGYTPVSYQKVKEIMTRKVFKPLDHHGNKEKGYK
jgi:calcineurin-like phosphoesterase family protein